MCPRNSKLLYYLYTNQVCSVKWDNELSDWFNVSNGVKQGGVIPVVDSDKYLGNYISTNIHERNIFGSVSR